MYTDKALELIASGTDCTTASPFFSTAFDLAAGIGVGGTVDGIISPDVGSGNQVVAIINVETYTAGSNTTVTFDVVSSVDTSFSDLGILIGSSGPILAADMELIDNAGRVGYAPIVVRLNPDHFSAIDVAGANARYLGIRITYATDPTALTVRASLADTFQGRPEVSHHKSGIVIA